MSNEKWKNLIDEIFGNIVNEVVEAPENSFQIFSQLSDTLKLMVKVSAVIAFMIEESVHSEIDEELLADVTMLHNKCIDIMEAYSKVNEK